MSFDDIPTVSKSAKNIQETIDNLPPQAKQATQMVMMFSGVLLMILSTYMLIDPDAIKELTLINNEVTFILGSFILFIGSINIIGALTIFRRKEKR